MKEVRAIIRPDRLERVLAALHEHPDLPGVTVSRVTGFGRVVGRGDNASPRFDSVEMRRVECLVADDLCETVVTLIIDRAGTGRPGDGKVAVVDVAEVARIRTGERGVGAL